MSIKEELIKSLLLMKPLRDGQDYACGESESIMIFEQLINQMIGIERATACVLAVHYFYNKDKIELNGDVTEVTKYPYSDIDLRVPAKVVKKVIDTYAHLKTLDKMPSSAIGALASLERYYNRANKFFAPIFEASIKPEVIKQLSVEKFTEITGINLPVNNLPDQLSSSAKILELKESKGNVSRERLKELPRVGDECADTLLVYVFKKRALIIDGYLRRILFRHKVIDSVNASRNKIENAIGSFIRDYNDSFNLHARIVELGVLYCVGEPNCNKCPLNKFEHRI